MMEPTENILSLKGVPSLHDTLIEFNNFCMVCMTFVYFLLYSLTTVYFSWNTIAFFSLLLIHIYFKKDTL